MGTPRATPVFVCRIEMLLEPRETCSHLRLHNSPNLHPVANPANTMPLMLSCVIMPMMFFTSST